MSREGQKVVPVRLALDEESWQNFINDCVDIPAVKEFRSGVGPRFKMGEIIQVEGLDGTVLPARVETFVQDPDNPVKWKVWLMKVNPDE